MINDELNESMCKSVICDICEILSTVLVLFQFIQFLCISFQLFVVFEAQGL